MANLFESPHPARGAVEGASERIPEHFDALVVLGKNWRQYPPHPTAEQSESFNLRLSIESKISALAAGEMFESGLIDKIIFSGGKTAGKQYPSEAEEMMKYMKEKYPDIADELVLLEKESIDTADNAERIAELLKENPTLHKIALMTVGFHLARAEKLFEEFGIETTGFPSEEELKKRSPHYEQFVTSYLKSGRVKFKERKEAIVRGLLSIDTRGKLLRKVTTKIRHSEE
jgi:uncharacterized SAM-binding protein YcdF (DUF218 family)